MGASVILAAAGRAERMGGIDKLLYEICGKSVLRWSIEAFLQAACTEEIILACAPERAQPLQKLLEQMSPRVPVKVVLGGKSRQESVLRGLEACSEKSDCIMVHDAARPMVQPQDIDRLYEAVIDKKKSAAALGVPLKDTVKEIREDGGIVRTVPRERLYIAQTPQAFEASLYRTAAAAAVRDGGDYTDDCQLIEAIGHTVYMLRGDYRNIKITTPEDLLTAETFLKERVSK